MSTLRTVTLAREDYIKAGAVLLEAAVRVNDEGEPELARDLLSKLVPIFVHAADSDVLREQERQIRERLGEYLEAGLRESYRGLVGDVD